MFGKEFDLICQIKKTHTFFAKLLHIKNKDLQYKFKILKTFNSNAKFNKEILIKTQALHRIPVLAQNPHMYYSLQYFSSTSSG